MPPSWVGPPHDASSKTAAATIVVKSRFMLQTPQGAHGCSLGALISLEGDTRRHPDGYARTSHQVVSVRGRNVSDHRTPQTDQVLIHRLWNVDTLQCLQASIRCFPYRPGCAQLLEKSRWPHITRSAEAQQCGECGAITIQREQRGHPVGIQKPGVLVPGGEHKRCLGNVAGPRLRRYIEPLALLAHFPACQAGQYGRA